jgi:SAM-dependent methyltransferase
VIVVGIMNRKNRILKHIDKEGIGLEIGPSHSPIAPKSEGFNVHIVDHTDKESLIKKYQPHGVKVENIENVDFIWHGETYAELTGRRNYYDWIIASHVIEHTPDLVSFINNCAEILKKDARFCFDCLRPLTGISKIIDAHMQKLKTHSVGTAVEYLSETITNGGRATWGYGKTRGSFEFIYSQDAARKVMKTYSSTEEYSDYHSWCFTPHSFRLLIHDLNLLELISLKEISFAPTRGCEFYITLGQDGMGPGLSRIELLKKIRSELRVDTTFIELLKLKYHHWITHIQQKFSDFSH